MCKSHMNAARQAKFRAGKAVGNWTDVSAIQEIYRMSDELTKQTGIQHNVDHIIPLHGENVSGLHMLSNLTILTAEENVAKSNTF